MQGSLRPRGPGPERRRDARGPPPLAPVDPVRQLFRPLEISLVALERFRHDVFCSPAVPEDDLFMKFSLSRSPRSPRSTLGHDWRTAELLSAADTLRRRWRRRRLWAGHRTPPAAAPASLSALGLYSLLAHHARELVHAAAHGRLAVQGRRRPVGTPRACSPRDTTWRSAWCPLRWASCRGGGERRRRRRRREAAARNSRVSRGQNRRRSPLTRTAATGAGRRARGVRELPAPRLCQNRSARVGRNGFSGVPLRGRHVQRPPATAPAGCAGMM